MFQFLQLRYLFPVVASVLAYFMFELPNFGQSQMPNQIEFETIELTENDPMKFFLQWRTEALAIPENSNVDAMTLATVKPDGQPSARTLQLREIDDLGYKIYTDLRSNKAIEIANNPRGALVFVWKHIKKNGAHKNRQVRIEGTIEKLSEAECQAYFDSEPVSAQIRATVNTQTKIITDQREGLKKDAQKLLDTVNSNPNYKIQKPRSYGGYRLRPTMMEFYEGDRDNINDRIRFRKQTEEEKKGKYGPGIFQGDNDWVYFQIEP